MIYFLWLILQVVSAELQTGQQYLRWTDSLATIEHPEKNGYLFYAEHHKRIASTIKKTGNIVTVNKLVKHIKTVPYGLLESLHLKPNTIRYLYWVVFILWNGSAQKLLSSC